MKLRNVLRIALAGALAQACTVTPDPVPAPRPLTGAGDSVEYAPFLRAGPHQLRGQAFLTTRGGDVKLAAGRLVTLDPATSYSREWFRRFGASVSMFEAPAPDRLFAAARRVAVANADGRFVFDGLPPGDYIVRSTVTWTVGDAPQGGVVAELVTVPLKQSAELVVSDLYNPEVAATLGVNFVTDAELARAHRTLSPRVKAISCQLGVATPPASEEEARRNLILRAASLAADGVARITCKKHGASFSPNCISRWECDGDAIVWT